jgi:unsaturated chondroitin disaccharide hydrolase
LVNRIALVFLGLLGCSCSDAGQTGSNASGGAAANGGVGGGGAGGAGGLIGSGGAGSAGGGSAGVSGSGAGGSAGTAGGGGTAGSGGAMGPDVAFCTTALDAAATQFAGFRGAYTNPSSIPRSAKNGTVNFVTPPDWTSGFVAGSFWYVYEHTQDEAFKTAAEAFTAALEGEKDSTDDHDLGFQFMSSYGNGYRLTNNAAYPAVIETAADSLMTRFSATVGAIESWDNADFDYPVIIDNMMNLRMLHHVSEATGDQAYFDAALDHAEKTLAHHFREDHSAFHLVNYKTSDGTVIEKINVQGWADDSSWARGQSWGLYGFTEMAGLSGRADFLAQAEAAAGYLMNHPNMPEDKVPYWDYSAPDADGALPERDASAAAIMASALLELSALAAEPAATTYRDFALSMLQSLSSSAYAAAAGTNSHFLLMHSSTGPVPSNPEYDDAINYADYYYLEALLRCKALASP